jgi:hypothetical protein
MSPQELIVSMFDDLHKMLMVHDIRVHGLSGKIDQLKALNQAYLDEPKAPSSDAQAKAKEAKAAEQSDAAKAEPPPAAPAA